jgi:hypothetical protein
MHRPCFPPTVCDQAPPFPCAGSLRVRFAGVAGTMRTLRLLQPVSPAHCVRLAIPTLRLLVRSLRFQAHFRRARGLGFGAARADGWALETTDLPGSWRTLLTVRSGLGPRWDRHARPLRRVGAAPACVNNEGSRPEKFRGSMSELSVRLSTLREDGRPPPRKTRFRLLARSTGWDWLPIESRRKVSELQSLHPFPLPQASPGAMTPFSI